MVAVDGVSDDIRGDPPASLTDRLTRGAVFGGIGLLLVYAAMAWMAGAGEMLEALSGVSPLLLLLPLAATLLSYVTMSLSYEGIARAAGSSVKSLDMLRITFVANAVNYLLPTGGLSGFALRTVMLRKKGVNSGKSVLISFTQTLITNFMLLLFILYGMGHLLLGSEAGDARVTAAVTVVVVLVLFLGAAATMILRRSLRNRFLGFCARAGHWVLRRLGKQEPQGRRLDLLLSHLNEGMEFLAERPAALSRPVAWIFFDWLFTVGILYAAFYSVGYPATYSQVAVGFSVSIVVAVISFVPGGVGVLEATMAATFAGVGIALKDSFLPIVIFRVCFYVIPVALALLLARGAFAEVSDEEAEAEEMLS